MPEKYQINPDRNKPWNALPDLPIDNSLFESVKIYKELVEAKSSLGKLQGRGIILPNQAVLINTISLQEAKASSEIENIFTTDDELYQAYSDNTQPLLDGRNKEILRYREALWEGNNFLAIETKFDLDYFIKVYQVLTQSNDGIRPPLAQIYIKQSGTGPNAGKPVYTPPRGNGVLEQKLANLVNFVNNTEDRIDPIIKMAIAHYQFEVIHPFRDGNGRTGRIFNIHYLVHAGLLDYPILYLSRYILDNRIDYYAGLAGVSQRGDWTAWICYMLKAVKSTAELTYYKVSDIINAKTAILDEVRKTKIRRPDPLVDAIFTQPYTKVKHLTDQGLYAENTAKKYLDQLVQMRILSLEVIKGNHYYKNMELCRILAEV